MTAPVLETRALSKAYGALHAVRAVDLTLMPGEIHALIGPNGAGKSTLVGLIAGGIRAGAGSVRIMGRDVTRLGPAARVRMGLGRTFQVSAVVPDLTVEANVALALCGRDGAAFWGLRGWRGAPGRVEEAQAHAARARLDGRLDVPAAALAHGERRRLEIAMALALRPRAFLMDEPMAGLGGEGAAELTALLSGLRAEAPVLLVEHDMDAVFALADRISVLVDGAVIASGPVDAVRADAAVRRAYLGEAP